LTSARGAEDATGGQGAGITCGGDVALLNSDRFKYQHALAVQRVRSNPDMVYLDLKYHVAWNVARRKPVFVDTADARDIIDKAFLACGSRVGGFASVLWLAPDHIHVYVESDGEKSIEAIVRELKLVSTSALREGLNSEGLISGRSRRVWDRAYFAETIG
jgi:REP element-mobilizing transposase RayT